MRTFFLTVATVALSLTTKVLANENWVQFITPTGEIAKHAKVTLPDQQQGTRLYITDSDGRVSIPSDPVAVNDATVEFAGRQYSLDPEDLRFDDLSRLQRVILDHK